MKISLKYGSGEQEFQLPPSAVEIRHIEPSNTVSRDRFKRDIHAYLYTMNRKVETVGILVSDKTRLSEFPVYLPLITEALEEHGFKKENITFYIAYGTHPRQTEEESLRAYGDTYRHYRFIHHDAREEAQLETLGTTTRGTEVRIRRDLFGHDLLITFGAILHHYFAGFGGGRKLFFPGLAGYDSILYNHSLFLDFEKRELREGCESGNLESNPLALDLEEISGMLPERLEIHSILNSKKEVCEIHFGGRYDQFADAAEQYDHYFRVDDPSRYDLVVASAGGYPKDINYIQAHKSVHNAASFVKDGGTLLILAECIDGVGNQAFMDLFRLGGKEAIFAAMEKQYVNNAGTALATLKKSARINIRFVTSLDEGACALMGMQKTSAEEARELVSSAKGEVAWTGNASIVYK